MKFFLEENNNDSYNNININEELFRENVNIIQENIDYQLILQNSIMNEANGGDAMKNIKEFFKKIIEVIRNAIKSVMEFVKNTINKLQTNMALNEKFLKKNKLAIESHVTKLSNEERTILDNRGAARFIAQELDKVDKALGSGKFYSGEVIGGLDDALSKAEKHVQNNNTITLQSSSLIDDTIRFVREAIDIAKENSDNIVKTLKRAENEAKKALSSQDKSEIANAKETVSEIRKVVSKIRISVNTFIKYVHADARGHVSIAQKALNAAINNKK